MANHRAFYLFFSIPAGILSTVYACCVFVETFPRLLTYIPYEGIDAIVKQIYLWIRVAYCALLLITSILACCYNSTYPFKYRQIYALRKARVKEADEGEPVWVSGYIVGGDLTQANASFTPPFSSNTNLVLGPRSSSSSRSSCLAVSLPKGDVRDALNLVDHPELLGKAVQA